MKVIQSLFVQTFFPVTKDPPTNMNYNYKVKATQSKDLILIAKPEMSQVVNHLSSLHLTH